MVVVDASGHPMKYDQLQIMENAVELAPGDQTVAVDVAVAEDVRDARAVTQVTERRAKLL